MGRKSKAKFELKGHTLPGINQKSETSNLKDGRSPSSALQMKSPMKEVSQYLKGANITTDPYESKDITESKIPAFSDFISTDTQSKLWDKFHEKRAKKKQDKDKPQNVDPSGTTPIIPQDINIVTNGEVTGTTSTSSRPEGTGPVTKDPNEGGFNIDRSNSLY